MIEPKWYERMTAQEFDDYEEDMSRLDLEDQFELLMQEQDERLNRNNNWDVVDFIDSFFTYAHRRIL
jgi:hypothetical protein